MNNINTAADFRDSVMKFHVLVMEKFDEISALVPDLDANNHNNVSNSPFAIKLSKINLPKCSGDVVQCSSFCNQFFIYCSSHDQCV